MDTRRAGRESRAFFRRNDAAEAPADKAADERSEAAEAKNASDDSCEEGAGDIIVEEAVDHRYGSDKVEEDGRDARMETARCFVGQELITR